MERKQVVKNKEAYYNYEIVDKYEAGIVLFGTEIKSIRVGKSNLKDSYANIDKKGEIYIYNMHISPYEFGNIFNKDPLRPKKLLLNKREIFKLIGYTSQKGYTLVPIEGYFSNNKFKILLGVGRGKKLHDKREDLKKKEAALDIKRQLKGG